MQTQSKKTKEAGEPKVIGSVNKAIDILEILAGSEDGLTATEISAGLGQSVSAAYHILNTLRLRDFITQDKRTKRYSIGAGVYRLCDSAGRRDVLRSAAQKCLNALAEKLDETGNLVVLDGTDIEYIAQAESSHSLMMFTRLGARVPFYCTGGGKAIFAYKTEEEQRKILRNTVLKPYTDNTFTDAEALLEEAKRIRERGLAYDNEEREIGITCIAAPVFNEYNEVIAAISISGPTYRFRTAGIWNLTAEVRKAAQKLSSALGSSFEHGKENY